MKISKRVSAVAAALLSAAAAHAEIRQYKFFVPYFVALGTHVNEPKSRVHSLSGTVTFEFDVTMQSYDLKSYTMNLDGVPYVYPGQVLISGNEDATSWRIYGALDGKGVAAGTNDFILEVGQYSYQSSFHYSAYGSLTQWIGTDTDVTAVPELSGYLLAAAGLLVAGYAARRIGQV